jgi:nitroreductase
LVELSIEQRVAVTDHVLTTTRAVRRRLDLDRAVPRELVDRCLEVAQQAPMGANIVRVRWVVIDDPATKSEIAAVYREAYTAYRADAVRRLEAAGRTDDRGLVSADHLAEVLDRVPVLVIPCHVDRLGPDVPTFARSVFYGSVLPAVWSFMLALRARGLGSSLTTLHLQDEARVAELLGIPPTATQLALLPVAWTVGDDFRLATRRPAASVTYWNRWPTP